MEQWQNENQEKSEKLGISEKLFRVFLFPSFPFCPTAKIENQDLKPQKKMSEISEISEVSEFSTWPSNKKLAKKFEQV